MKTGRNAPCPCGSGQKYKKCCLNKVIPSSDLIWRRLDHAHQRLVDRLAHFVREELDEVIVPLAADEFFVWPDLEHLHPLLQEHHSVFLPWFYFNWVYDPDEEVADIVFPEMLTIADVFIDRFGSELDELEQRFVGTMIGTPFSFYEVQSCDAGHGMVLQDLLVRKRWEVIEKTASQDVQPGDVLFARIVSIDAIAMMVGTGSIKIPETYKPMIAELKAVIQYGSAPASVGILDDFDMEIRELYFSIYDDLTGFDLTRRDQRLLQSELPDTGTIVKGARREGSDALILIYEQIEGADVLQQCDGAYTQLALKLAHHLDTGTQFSLSRGRPVIWAAAIIEVIARINFLFDPENPDHFTRDQLCASLGVKPATIYNKALQIRNCYDLYPGSEHFCVPRIRDQFAFYETSEGLIIPKNIVKSIWMTGGASSVHKTSPQSGLKVVKSDELVETHEGDIAKQPQKIRRPSKRTPADDPNQMKLFDD
jgi:hypothetical protein